MWRERGDAYERERSPARSLQRPRLRRPGGPAMRNDATELETREIALFHALGPAMSEMKRRGFRAGHVRTEATGLVTPAASPYLTPDPARL